jgi:predicted Zn-ribbon and HTH transcriptional regulator
MHAMAPRLPGPPPRRYPRLKQRSVRAPSSPPTSPPAPCLRIGEAKTSCGKAALERLVAAKAEERARVATRRAAQEAWRSALVIGSCVRHRETVKVIASGLSDVSGVLGSVTLESVDGISSPIVSVDELMEPSAAGVSAFVAARRARDAAAPVRQARRALKQQAEQQTAAPSSCDICGHSFCLPQMLTQLKKGSQTACPNCKSPVAASLRQRRPRQRPSTAPVRSQRPPQVDRPSSSSSGGGGGSGRGRGGRKLTRRVRGAAESPAFMQELQQERLARVCPMCERGGTGYFCTPHHCERVAGRFAQECGGMDPAEAWERLAKADWNFARAIGDIYLTQSQRLGAVCPLCEDGGRGAPCESHKSEWEENLARACPDCASDDRAHGQRCDAHMLVWLMSCCPDCEDGGQGARCEEHALARKTELQRIAAERAEKAAKLAARVQKKLASACPDCRRGGRGTRCERHEQIRLSKICPGCESGGAGIKCRLHEREHRIAFEAAKAEKRKITAEKAEARRVALVRARREEARLSKICPDCEVAGTGPRCEEHEEERCAHACPQCDQSGVGLLCDEHEEQRLMAVCPLCDAAGEGPLCEMHSAEQEKEKENERKKKSEAAVGAGIDGAN